MERFNNVGWVLFWGLYIWVAVSIGGMFHQRGLPAWDSYRLGLYWPMVIRVMTKPLEEGQLYER